MFWLRMLGVGALLGGLSVVVGAFGAHYLKTKVAPSRLVVFETGVRYHMFHALALCLVALTASRVEHIALRVSSGAFILGMLLFSGSLYALTFAPAARWLGPLTPLGGVFLIVGWVAFAVAAFSV